MGAQRIPLGICCSYVVFSNEYRFTTYICIYIYIYIHTKNDYSDNIQDTVEELLSMEPNDSARDTLRKVLMNTRTVKSLLADANARASDGGDALLASPLTSFSASLINSLLVILFVFISSYTHIYICIWHICKHHLNFLAAKAFPDTYADIPLSIIW